MSAPFVRRPTWAILSLLAAGLLSSASASAHETGCRDVHGTLSSEAVGSPCDSAIGLCTAGTLDDGNLHATFSFSGDSFSVSDPTIPMFHYTGPDVFVLASGSTVIGMSDGFVNGVDGALTDTITISGGTGSFSNASGTIVVTGNFDLGAGTGHSTFTGRICRNAGQDDPDVDNGV
jgi:hypothetical protein